MAVEAIHMNGLKISRFDAVSLLGTGAIVLVALIAGYSLHYGGERAVSHLQVEGAFQHVKPDAVRAAVIEQLGDGLVSLNLDMVREAAEKLPWVSRARAERIWPADVRVRVWERMPIARWGEKNLLSTEAMVFTPAAADIESSLPLLAGPSGHEREIMETYKGLSERLHDTPFALTSLALDARGEWTARASNGIELRLGRERPESKLDTIMGPLTRALGQRLQEVNYVDLRYTNGFAVAWRAPAAVVQPASVLGEEKNHE